MLGLGLLLLPAVCGATPDPDVNPRNLLRHLPSHRHARYDLSQPPPHPTASLAAQQVQGKPKPKPTCPPEYAAEALKSGMISVASFLNSSRDDPGKEHVDDAPAIRAAIATATNCSASVFFPPGGYSLHTTVVRARSCAVAFRCLLTRGLAPGAAGRHRAARLGPGLRRVQHRARRHHLRPAGGPRVPVLPSHPTPPHLGATSVRRSADC